MKFLQIAISFICLVTFAELASFKSLQNQPYQQYLHQRRERSAYEDEPIAQHKVQRTLNMAEPNPFHRARRNAVDEKISQNKANQGIAEPNVKSMRNSAGSVDSDKSAHNGSDPRGMVGKYQDRITVSNLEKPLNRKNGTSKSYQQTTRSVETSKPVQQTTSSVEAFKSSKQSVGTTEAGKLFQSTTRSVETSKPVQKTVSISVDAFKSSKQSMGSIEAGMLVQQTNKAGKTVQPTAGRPNSFNFFEQAMGNILSIIPNGKGKPVGHHSSDHSGGHHREDCKGGQSGKVSIRLSPSSSCAFGDRKQQVARG